MGVCVLGSMKIDDGNHYSPSRTREKGRILTTADISIQQKERKVESHTQFQY